MLDTSFMKQLLQAIGDTQYEGIRTGDLINATFPSGTQDNDFLRFKYHMDEMWQAGLIKGRDGPGSNGWGYSGRGPNFTLISIPLVLTPIGSELLTELNKPKGLERLKQAMRSAGALAGTEALRHGVGALLGAIG